MAEDVFKPAYLQLIIEAFEKNRAILRPAKIGKGVLKTLKPQIRNDYMAWLERADISFAPVWTLLDLLLSIARKELFFAVKRYETQLALYPPKHFYDRHVDRHKTFPSRILTMAFYLNDWQPDDGGELVLYTHATEKTVVSPNSNKMILFLSELEHQVLPTNIERKSLTTWFRDDI